MIFWAQRCKIVKRCSKISYVHMQTTTTTHTGSERGIEKDPGSFQIGTNVRRVVDLLGKIRQWIWIRTFALFISVIFNFHFQKHKILFSYQLDEFLNPQICNIKFIQMFWNKNITKMWLKWDWNRLEMSIFNPKNDHFWPKNGHLDENLLLSLKRSTIGL